MYNYAKRGVQFTSELLKSHNPNFPSSPCIQPKISCWVSLYLKIFPSQFGPEMFSNNDIISVWNLWRLKESR